MNSCYLIAFAHKIEMTEKIKVPRTLFEWLTVFPAWESRKTSTKQSVNFWLRTAWKRITAFKTVMLKFPHVCCWLLSFQLICALICMTHLGANKNCFSRGTNSSNHCLESMGGGKKCSISKSPFFWCGVSHLENYAETNLLTVQKRWQLFHVKFA